MKVTWITEHGWARSTWETTDRAEFNPDSSVLVKGYFFTRDGGESGTIWLKEPRVVGGGLSIMAMENHVDVTGRNVLETERRGG